MILRPCGRGRPLPKSDESYDKAETESGDGFGGSRREYKISLEVLFPNTVTLGVRVNI